MKPTFPGIKGGVNISVEMSGDDELAGSSSLGSEISEKKDFPIPATQLKKDGACLPLVDGCVSMVSSAAPELAFIQHLGQQFSGKVVACP